MTSTQNNTPGKISPPTRHQLAVMIWLCVFPTLTALNLALGDQLAALSPVPRTFVLATIAVPIVGDTLAEPMRPGEEDTPAPRGRA